MKLGLYCGTFKPFHLGHLNVYHKAKELFDDVIVAQGINPGKVGETTSIEPIFVPEGIMTRIYCGLTTDLIRSYLDRDEFTKVVLVRGIRNGYDYDYEMNQIEIMRDLLPTLQVVLIPCDREFARISSTMIRQLTTFDKTLAAQYIP